MSLSGSVWFLLRRRRRCRKYEQSRRCLLGKLLFREMGAKLGRRVADSGRWVAILGRWVAKLERWVAKLWRWVAKLVARQFATAALWVRN